MPSPRRRDPITRPLRHSGLCGRRETCWMAECRQEFGDLRTVEVLLSGVHLAYCHGVGVPARDVEIQTWADERRQRGAA
jgi:hypothetical protein